MERRHSREAPMRRFTPPAASPAIGNCGLETLAINAEI
jgi:hypothetical protein